MGLLDRLRGSGNLSAEAQHAAVETAEQSATRLLEEGMALEEEARLDEALQRYDAAIQLMPELARAHFNRGNILLDRGDAAHALAAYTQAVAYKPDSAAAHYNIGNAHLHLGHPEAAVTAYNRAIELKPEFADAHVALGGVQETQGQLEAAAASYRHALLIQPDYAEVHGNLGGLLKGLGRLDEAVECYRQALRLKPDYVEVLSSMGVMLQDLGNYQEAIACHQRALVLKPDFALAHGNLGYLLLELGDFDHALMSLRRALELKPDFGDAYDNLLFIHNYLGDQPASLMREEAEAYGATVARQAKRWAVWPNCPDANRPMRIGLVSGDLCNHPVGHFLESVLAAVVSHAAGKIRLIAYLSDKFGDAVSERIKTSCEGWHPVVGLSDEHFAQRIREDQIDILIDLSGHTAHNRLPVFAWKPAPVQVSWLGYFATTGVAEIDYLIADPWTLPASEECNFTEKIWRLPETRLCFTPPDEEVSVSPLPALANGYVSFGCFNNLSKMNDAVVALWSRVLHAVPGSRLFLKARQLMEASVRQSIAERFAVHGVDAARLIFEDYTPRGNYLAAYQRIDIALDPFPYPGGTTSVEALWMGVPVLTLAGERFLSRQGVGLLMNAGLPEWIATDPDDYVARAVSHASDLERLAELRRELRQQVLASPIFDAPRFARHFEAALRGMWKAWCDTQTAQSGLTKKDGHGPA